MMNNEIRLLFSDYLLGLRSFEEIRSLIDAVDWDDLSISEVDRSVLLHLEALIAGIDAGLNEESDVQDYLVAHVGVITSIGGAGVMVIAGANNSEYQLRWADSNDWNSPSIQMQEVDPSGLNQTHASR